MIIHYTPGDDTKVDLEIYFSPLCSDPPHIKHLVLRKRGGVPHALLTLGTVFHSPPIASRAECSSCLVGICLKLVNLSRHRVSSYCFKPPTNIPLLYFRDPLQSFRKSSRLYTPGEDTKNPHPSHRFIV